VPRPSRSPSPDAKKSYDGYSRACPDCSGPAEFQRWQPRTVASLFGDVRLTRG
jgi:hypothetical protein